MNNWQKALWVNLVAFAKTAPDAVYQASVGVSYVVLFEVRNQNVDRRTVFIKRKDGGQLDLPMSGLPVACNTPPEKDTPEGRFGTNEPPSKVEIGVARADNATGEHQCSVTS